MTHFQLDKKVVCSFTQSDSSGFSDEADGGDYVFELDQSIDANTIATSMSDNSLIIYDSSTLNIIQKIQAHKDTINAIEFSKVSPYLLYSASSDHHVCLWDIRTSESASMPCIKLKLADEVTGVSVSMSDSLLAAACESSIKFYDVRGGSVVQNKKHNNLGEYADVHSDLITQLKFNPSQPHVLTSASEDGLISVFDTSTTEKDEAVVSILNTECPIRKFGYFGTSSECIYALSTVETASFWHFPSAQRLAHFPAIRESLSVEYLVDCIYEPVFDKLYLLAGDYAGTGVVAEVEPGACKEVARLSGGHASMIRCCNILRNSSSATAVSGDANGPLLPSVGRIFTGGEDSRVCSWSPTTAVGSATQHNNFVHSSGDNYKKKHDHKSGLKQKKDKSASNEVRYKPY